MTEPKLQTPSPPRTDGPRASGNWYGGQTQSLVPNRHWSGLFTFNLLGPSASFRSGQRRGLRHLFLSPNNPSSLCSRGKATLIHSFMVVPQCPVALMGHDLLGKLQTSTNLPFLDSISILCIQMTPEPLASPHSQNLPPDLPLIDPQVWDTEAPLVA